MTNKTSIEWTDRTWNPVTGCWGPDGTRDKPNWCEYCYAINRTALRTERFRDKALKEGRAQVLHHSDRCRYFAPTFYPYRLEQPLKIKKPQKIFVVSMGDLFGDWVPKKWIYSVIEIAEKCPQHIFQFLTKNPKRYLEFNYPKNCWLGATATNLVEWKIAVKVFWDLGLRKAENRRLHFISCEPLLGKILELGYPTRYEAIDWLIIGGLSGSEKKREAVRKDEAEVLIKWAQNLEIPVFVKDNLFYPLRIQQFPQG